MSTTTETPEFKILSRVSSLPLVASALGYGYLKYNQIKQANPILDQGLSIAESTVAFAASNAKPVVAKFTPTCKYRLDFPHKWFVLEISENFLENRGHQ